MLATVAGSILKQSEVRLKGQSHEILVKRPLPVPLELPLELLYKKFPIGGVVYMALYGIESRRLYP